MKFEAVILSRNRPDFINKAVNSVLNQSQKFDNFYISDNSTINNNNFNLNNNINVVSRGGKLDLYEHFSIVIKESNYDYIIILHDDDYLHVDYLKTVKKNIKNKDNILALGINGYFIENNNKTKKIIFKNNKNFIRRIEPFDLLKRYLDVDCGGVAPFSGYLYDVKKIKKNISLPCYSKGNNYADTIFIYNISLKKGLYWLDEKLINVTLHENSLSNNSGLDYKIFISFLKKNLYKKKFKLSYKKISFL